ncbi:MAG TPA: hypothetical protein ENI08_01720 [Candidatus Dependentiae bacterium]|nr:hypothetical protein [Candidatus Dependentiae bacterium]
MGSRIKKLFAGMFEVEKRERLKLILLGLSYFLIIGAYTVTRDLKNSIFISIVGKEYIPWAKVIGMLVLIPAIFFYSRLVDRVRRYQLLCFYSLFFGLGSLIFMVFIGHPQIGISNTDTSPYRMFGWLFYFFIEGYSPFIVSVFWAFANSITSPESAKKNYGLMASGSKLGGMMSAGIVWILFSMSARASPDAFFTVVRTHQLALGFSSLLLCFVPIVILTLMRRVPGHVLHGYEAVYQVEKQKRKAGLEKTGVFAGLRMFTKYPYVLGIFGMVYFYEIIATVLGYLRLGLAQSHSENISDVSRVLFEMVFKTHALGFLISFFGTGVILRRLGTRICLLLTPLLVGAFLLYLMFETTPQALINAIIAFEAINYAFTWPVRESLYIPTIKEIKFKSKSWIDAFGSKFAKTSGSTFNIFSSKIGSTLLLPAHSFFFACIVGAWFVTSFFIGRRFDRAIADNEVIGIDADEEATS